MSFFSAYNNLSKRGWEGIVNPLPWELVANRSPALTANNYFGTEVAFSFDGQWLGINRFQSATTSNGVVSLYSYSPPNYNYGLYANIVGPTSNVWFGQDFAISNDAEYIVASLPVDSSNNYVHIYNRSGNTFTLQANIANFAGVNNNFGKDVVIDGTGTYVGIGSSQNVYHIYQRSGNTWSLQANLTVAGMSVLAGQTSTINYYGNVLAIGDRTNEQVYIFNRSGNTWTHTANIDNADTGSYIDQYADGLKLNGEGNVITISNPTYGTTFIGNITNNFNGIVYVYNSSGNTWTLEQRITPSSNNTYFGSSVDLSKSANLLSIGASNVAVGNNSNAGTVYIYTKANQDYFRETNVNAGNTTFDNFGTGTAITDFERAPGNIQTLQEIVVGTSNVATANNAGIAYIYARINPYL